MKQVIMQTVASLLFIVSFVFAIYEYTSNDTDGIEVRINDVTPKRGKDYIGMNATLLYLIETNQVDSVTIDVLRLVEIQDSISSKDNSNE